MSEIIEDQLDAAFNDGYSAAKEGYAEDYCPQFAQEELRYEWQTGWQEWHADQGGKQ